MPWHAHWRGFLVDGCHKIASAVPHIYDAALARATRRARATAERSPARRNNSPLAVRFVRLRACTSEPRSASRAPPSLWQCLCSPSRSSSATRCSMASSMNDEGAAAHLFQLLMVGQVPVVAFFVIKWARRLGCASVPVLASQVAAAGAAFASVWWLT